MEKKVLERVRNKADYENKNWWKHISSFSAQNNVSVVELRAREPWLQMLYHCWPEITYQSYFNLDWFASMKCLTS